MKPITRFLLVPPLAKLFVLIAFTQAQAQVAAATRLDRVEADLANARAKIELAQGYRAPPADVGDGSDGFYAQPPQDSASLLVRIDRLESQMRQINGQIEQLQFGFRKLEDQLKKFEQDVDFRFQEGSGRGAAPASGPKPLQKRVEAPESSVEPGASDPDAEPLAPPPSAPPATARSTRRSDAFDPASAPDAPGAPRPLGGGMAAASGDIDAPLDLSGGKLRNPPQPPAAGNLGVNSPPTIASLSAAAAGNDLTAPANPARAEYDAALGYYRQKEYANAEKGFSAFLQKNPKNKMAPDAIYYLGESFFRRGRQREAAEQYLKISTQYANAPRAPDALLRLGQSLFALGAREQACATYAEIGRKYPNASAAIKAGADREARRAQC